MKRLKKLVVLCAVMAVAVLSFGPATASAVPPPQSLPQSCHGFHASSGAHAGGGLGHHFEPGELGQTQQQIRGLCKGA